MNILHKLVTLVSLSSTGATASRFTVFLCAAQSGASPAMVGLLAALFAGVGAIASVPAGRAIDRSGTKKPLLLSAAMLAVAVSLGVFWRELPMLFVIVILGGLAHNTMIIAFQRLAGDLAAPSERAQSFGMMGFGFSISILAAPVIAGFAIDHVGFSGTFLLFTLIPVCSFAMVWMDMLPWSPGTRARPERPTGEASVRSGTLGLLRAPKLKPLWICGAVFESGWMAFGFLLPILGTRLGFSASKIGLIAGTAGLLLFFTRGSLTPLLRHFTPWQLIVAGLALSGVGFTGMAMTHEFLWMAVASALIGIGQGTSSPMMSALIYERAPSHETGEAMALRTLVANASQGSMPLVAGALSSVIGIAPVFGMVAVGLFGTAWLCRGQWRHKRTQQRDGG